jgi:hypothetical protein
MYLWKYWRESRIAFGIGIAVLAVFTALSVRGHVDGGADPRQFSNLIVVLLFVFAAPLGFFAWTMGSFGVGRSLGEGAGSYLLTRPKRRSWFVWRDWAFGIAFIAVMVGLTNLLMGWILHRVTQSSGGPFSGEMILRDMTTQVPVTHLMGLSGASIFLCCGVVFGVVYVATIIMKSALGNMVGAGVLLGYVILAALIEHYWKLKLPDLLLRTYIVSPGGGVSAIADHLGISMTIRAGVLLLFPIAAQLVLDRSDI